MILYFKKLCVLGLSIIYSIAAFELVCPHLSHRRFRALHVCQNTSMSDYACLFDIYLEMYTESCDKVADFVLPGEQYVISGARLSSPCSSKSNRYQPFLFWSNIQSQCYYQKSLCNEAGQLIYSQNSTKDDSTCHCDYTQGYGFAIEPKNPCYCIPSEEDCSCYKVQCPANTVLSADYKCTSHQNKAYKGLCQSIVTRTDNSSVRETSIDLSDPTKDISKQSAWIWLTSLVIIGISIISGLYICVRLKNLCFRCISRYIEIILDEFAEISYEKNNGRNSTDISVATQEETMAPELATIHDQHELIILDMKQFRKQLIGHWRKIKKRLEPISMLAYLLKHNAIDQDKYDELKLSRIDVQSSFILLHFLELESDTVANDFQYMCKDTKSNITQFLTRKITTKRWPLRDIETCVKRIRSENKSLREKIKLREFLDVCFEHFMCSVKDYKDVIHEVNKRTGQKEDEFILSQIEFLLNKGSFECLLDFVKDQTEIFENLNKNLPPAIFITRTDDVKIMSSQSPETQVLRNKRIKLHMHIPYCEEHIQLVFQDRIKYCSKWFIKEFAMYPDNTTVGNDNSLECVPLFEDVQWRLIKSTHNGDFDRVMKLYFCGKDVVYNLPSEKEIQISMLVVKTNSHDCNLRVEAPHYDIAMFLSDQRQFLLDELQPSVFISALPENSKTFFKEIDWQNAEREESATQVLKIIHENDLSKTLLEIVSTKDEFYQIHERFIKLQNAYLKSSDVAANIIDDIVNLATGIFDLNAIKAIIIEKNVFIDDSFPKFTSGTAEDREEHMVIEFLVRIVLAGHRAIGTFVYALYVDGEDTLADTLSSARIQDLDEYSDIDVIEHSSSKNMLFQTRFKIGFA